MWKINWNLVSALIIIGGLISVFVYPDQKIAIAIIFIIALIITAFMADESEIRTEKIKKELIKKYYNIYGDFTSPWRQDIVEELTKEIRRETGRKLSTQILLADSSLVIREITRNRERQERLCNRKAEGNT